MIYSFKGGADGMAPFASLFALNGKLYGTTVLGGVYEHGSDGRLTLPTALLLLI